MEGFTFVTGWFRRHGIAFLDMAISTLAKANLQGHLGHQADVKPNTVLVDGENQYDLARALGYWGRQGQGEPLSTFTRVMYLVPKNRKGLSEVRPLELVAGDKWKSVMDSVERSCPDWDNWKEGFETLRAEIKQGKAFPDLGWFQSKWNCKPGDDRLRLLWHVINEAPLIFQLEWYKAHSPLYAANRERIEFVDLNVDNAESPGELAQEMYRWLQEKDRLDERLLVNLRGTGTAVQFGWYYLAWRMPVLKNAVFIECLTERGTRTERFVPIKVVVVPKDPIAELGLKLAPKSWESSEREKAKTRLSFFFKQDDNFSILLLGERGTGKSRSVRKAWEAKGGNPDGFHEANCANFTDPVHARSELFGHMEGAFSGARSDREGLFEQSNEGLLFLDEIHHLDPATRAMLITALQTDNNGKYSFTPLGASEPKKSRFQLVVASNWRLRELREELKPDFLDRISQRLLEFPAIEDEEREGAWNSVWKEMAFMGKNLVNPESEEGFLDWLKDLEIPGNFRDLQRIAIQVADYQRGCAEQKDGAKLGFGSDLHQWLDLNISRWDNRSDSLMPGAAQDKEVGDLAEPSVVVPFDLDSQQSDEKGFLRECRRQFVKEMIARFKTQKKAIAKLNERGSMMTEGTLSNWKLGRSGS